ncbi:hypothetical protein F4779DRAFT_342404 [Xylariaceae sp. FL0662B]|nr:hypothetical protein F4779DRAFT_342404 [Xylariaceae sp. FL0662B]
MASISIRESIRWPPAPASEPTSTLVLTSPGRRFVDIRVLEAAEGEGEEGDNTNAPPQHLDWAFAGTSSRDGAHATWHHVVDSRTRCPAAVVDEAVMSALDDARTLECGRAVDPATGRAADYEEVWRDVEPGGRCVVLELRRDGEEEGKEVVEEERGMVVCFGAYCQGVVRMGDAFAAERWVRMDEDGGGGWKRDVSVGSLPMPCRAAMEDAGLALGSEVRLGEQVWRVVEIANL